MSKGTKNSGTRPRAISKLQRKRAMAAKRRAKRKARAVE